MKDHSKTSGVPRHQERTSRRHRPVPGGSLNEKADSSPSKTTAHPRHTLQYLIGLIKQSRPKAFR